jgi:YidC/Oxa1 family membrane protein insertase
MLIQMPIWFALYRTIYSAVELYQAPLFGWITDLSAYDPYFVLPLLLGLATFLQQKFTPQAGDPSQAKVMLYAMPIMFTVFMLFMPSGLTFYILINSILTVGQQWWIQRNV